jgi:SAM-dependent methyltransferase
MFQVGARHGYLEEMRLIKEVLAWPVKWSRLFGIAEIITPAVKISTRTDWTPRKDEFSTSGMYRQPKKTWWTNNGFDNALDLGRAHGDMVNALITHLPQKARVLDLGCGNGMLLRRLTIHRPDVRVAGIDSNADAIREAQETIDLRSTFWSGKIEDGIWRDWNPTAVLYTPGRMMETNTGGMSEAATLRVATWIRDIPWQFPYIYDDMILRKINVPALCEDKQLPVPLPLIKTPLVEMGIVAPFT